MRGAVVAQWDDRTLDVRSREFVTLDEGGLCCLAQVGNYICTTPKPAVQSSVHPVRTCALMRFDVVHRPYDGRTQAPLKRHSEHEQDSLERAEATPSPKRELDE